MLIKEDPLGACWRWNAPAREACHDLTEKSRVVFGLRTLRSLFEAEIPESFPQPRERTAIQRIGQVVRRIRQECPLAQSCKEGKELARRRLLICPARRI